MVQRSLATWTGGDLCLTEAGRRRHARRPTQRAVLAAPSPAPEEIAE
jgi:hypothetical protein